MAKPLDPEMSAALQGATAEVRHHVTDADTAAALGSGDLPLLGTPRMIALMEQAACRALLGRLPPQYTSVGTHVDIRHVRPTLAGGDVVAHAELTAADGSRLTFSVRAAELRGDDLVDIGLGTHVRVIVDRAGIVASA